MSALTSIDLHGTRVPPSDLGHLRNATSLSHSKVVDQVSAQFSDFCLPRLASLTLWRVDVTGGSPILSLTSLTLSGCTTIRDTKESLGRLTSLTKLEVRDNHDFEDDGLLLMPLSITDLVVPNFQRLGIQRLTNLVSWNIVIDWMRMNPWLLCRIADSMPPRVRSLTMTDWSAREWGHAIDATLTMTSLTSLSIMQRSRNYLGADAFGKLAAATHLSSVTVNGKAVAPS
jgi:hypothetical protein